MMVTTAVKAIPTAVTATPFDVFKIDKSIIIGQLVIDYGQLGVDHLYSYPTLMNKGVFLAIIPK